MVVFVGLMSGSLVAALDQNMLTTALPSIAAELGGLDRVPWVVTAYLLTTAMSTPAFGKLGDQFGRKRLFQASIVIFVVGAVLSGVSQSISQLIAFRAIQGIGAGGILVGSQAIVGDIAEPARRGRYQANITLVWATASVAGPLLGGVFVQHLSWRWSFFVSIPIGVTALVVTSRVLRPTSPRRKPAIDWLGAVILSGAVACVVLVTTLGGTHFPLLHPVVLSLVCGGIVLLGSFAWAERRAPDPLVPLRLFAVGPFRISSITSALVGFGVLGTMTLLPLYLQIVRGATPVQAGLMMTPVMLSMVVTSIVCGRLIVRRGRYRIFPIIGTGLMACGLSLLSMMGPDTSLLLQYGGMAVLGIGMGSCLQVLMLTAQNAVALHDLGVATSTITFTRSMGASLGVAVFGAIFTARLTTELSDSSFVSDGELSLRGLTPELLSQLGAAARQQIVDAVADALHTIFLTAVFVVLVGLVLSSCVRELPLRGRTEQPQLPE